MDREQAARAIVATGRAARKPVPRWLWVLAVVVAAACIAPLVHAWLAAPDAGSRSPAAPPAVAGSELGTGIALGFVAGVLVGFAVARARRR